MERRDSYLNIFGFLCIWGPWGDKERIYSYKKGTGGEELESQMVFWTDKDSSERNNSVIDTLLYLQFVLSDRSGEMYI